MVSITQKPDKSPKLIFAITWLINFSLCQKQFVYTINHIRSFNQQKIGNDIGCVQKHVAYGTYLYPIGPIDALNVYLNPHTYNTYFSCMTVNVFAKLFGTGQNYEQLLGQSPTYVANQVKQMIRINNMIVNWKVPCEMISQKSHKWLDKFIQVLLNKNVDVYVKAPASYFCYLEKGKQYILGLENAKKYIVEMFGQQVGVYMTYEQMFGKQKVLQIIDNEHYTEDCPKYPSYSTLVKKTQGKEFFIGKTLNKEQTGYVGPQLNNFLEQSKGIYRKLVFFDDYPPSIIQL